MAGKAIERQRRTQALEAHSLVLEGMSSQVQGYLKMGAGLKLIRDNRLYVELGYGEGTGEAEVRGQNAEGRRRNAAPHGGDKG